MVLASCGDKYYRTNFISAVPTSLLIAPGLRTIQFLFYFRATYLNSYLVGEGMSGLVPAVIALLQGVGGNPYCQNVTLADGTIQEQTIVPEPRFSIEVFFSILCAMMVVSSIAFLLMNNLTMFKAEMVNSGDAYTKPQTQDDDYGATTDNKNSTTVSRSETDLVENGGLDEGFCCDVDGQFYLLMALQFYSCFVSNSFLSSIQTYSTLPYGNTVYHLSVTLSSMANPVMAFAAFFFPTYNVGVIYGLSAVGSALAAFILSTALYSPDVILGMNGKTLSFSYY
jgi:riboflavin transporter 2